jgi:hypothetical protein
MRRYPHTLALVCFFALVSCGDFLFPPLEVVAVSVPSGYVALGDIGSSVTVTFSAPLAPHTAQQALRVSEDGAAFKGRIDVAKQSVIFTPFAGFSVNKDYELSVTVDLEDEKGISLANPLLHRFSTRSDHGSPVVTSVLPAPNAELTESLSFMELHFSKPVDRASLARALSLSPSFDYTMDFSGDSAVIRPASPLKNSQRYLVTISTELCDLAGNRLALAWTSTFLNGTDFSPPAYTLRAVLKDGILATNPLESGGMVNKGLRAPCILRIDFNEPILVSARSGLITASGGLQAKIDVNKETGTSATITLPLEWGARCGLTIKKGIADLSENRTAAGRTFTLLADHEAARPVTVVSSRLYAAGLGSGAISLDHDYAVLLFPSAAFPLDTLRLATWTVLVRISADAASVTRASAMAALRVNAGNSCLGVSIRTLAVNPAPDDGNGGRLVELTAGLEISNKDARGLIHFNVAKTLADNLGNTLAAPWTVVLNKE